MLVCPECGNDKFTVRQVRYVEVTVQYSDGGVEYDEDHTVLDVDDDNDYMECTSCFDEFYRDSDSLVTQEQYDEADNE